MVKIYMTFDFKSVDKRIEKTKIDPYAVHSEDFENINDLVRRSVITHSPMKEDKVEGLVYDTEQELEEFYNGNGANTYGEPKQSEAGEAPVSVEQSEDLTGAEPAQYTQAKP